MTSMAVWAHSVDSQCKFAVNCRLSRRNLRVPTQVVIDGVLSAVELRACATELCRLRRCSGGHGHGLAFGDNRQKKTIRTDRVLCAPSVDNYSHCTLMFYDQGKKLSGSGYFGYPPGMVPGMRKRGITPHWVLCLAVVVIKFCRAGVVVPAAASWSSRPGLHHLQMPVCKRYPAPRAPSKY